jgi:amino acid transporter
VTLRGANLSGIALGATVAIFSLVGFESATSLGEEARNQLRSIPSAVILSVIVAGAFFIFCAYAEVLAARGLATPLDKMGAPLDTLADTARLPALKIAIDVGALLSSFSITLAALNAGGRIVFDKSRSGLFPRALGVSHAQFRTPHVALAFFAGVLALVGGGMLVAGIAPLDAFNDTATLGSFGFIAIYVFVAVGAPFYLRRLGELRPYHVAISAFTLGLLLIPAVGSVYPVPAPPTNAFPFVFAAYFVLGVVLLWSRSGRLPTGDAEPATT